MHNVFLMARSNNTERYFQSSDSHLSLSVACSDSPQIEGFSTSVHFHKPTSSRGCSPGPLPFAPLSSRPSPAPHCRHSNVSQVWAWGMAQCWGLRFTTKLQDSPKEDVLEPLKIPSEISFLERQPRHAGHVSNTAPCFPDRPTYTFAQGSNTTSCPIWKWDSSGEQGHLGIILRVSAGNWGSSCLLDLYLPAGRAQAGKHGPEGRAPQGQHSLLPQQQLCHKIKYKTFLGAAPNLPVPPIEQLHRSSCSVRWAWDTTRPFQAAT